MSFDVVELEELDEEVLVLVSVQIPTSTLSSVTTC